ncbi:alpha/beta hydrolase fold domain-containing protein [Nonomuraea phyllanthi]|uniref:alpha/beta fold hydrolase n=1 Tax=Nonomuraea phyllanthi TaxID=2219224 RepID=UPI001292E632|nr:alpha/beta hydrolase [Nonomuraea phyllanthi]QFY09916.1 alpha/beta hydrolase fold domain-containing protein [Nonomuraea phyllanthi]
MTNQPTLVFIPCFSGAPWDLEQLTPLAHRPRRTFRLPENVDDMEAYADAAAAHIADLDDYVLVGDSFGANIALALAIRRPAGLRGLVMSGGFAANPISSPLWKAAMRLMGRLRGGPYRQLVLRAHAHRLASPHDREGQIPWSEADSRHLFLTNTPATSFGARLTAALDADYTDRLDKVAVPTLIITPSHDKLIGEEAAEIMRAGIPGAREIVLEGTGHMFRFSHPVTYGRAVETFLAERVDEPEVAGAAR